MDKKSVLIIKGGISSEHDVSLNSGRMIQENIDHEKYDISTGTILKNGCWKFNNNDGELSIAEAISYLGRQKFDIAFLALHGVFGEDGKIQAICEAIGLNYTGSGVESSILAMSKSISGGLFKSIGLNVPKFTHISKNAIAPADLFFPIIIKPCHGGSSIGVEKINDVNKLPDALQNIYRIGDSAIIQEYIKGREFTCGILEISGNPVALPPTEIIPKSGGMFDYESKYVPGSSVEVTPPELPEVKIKEVQGFALDAHRILGCSGMSRSDFVLKNDVFYILETNTIPGMTATSLLPQEAKAAGIDFTRMLDYIIDSGLNRNKIDPH